MGENRDYIVYSEEKGTINISEDVAAVVAANAALDTEGVASLATSLSKDIAEFLGKKSVSKGVKITIEENSLKADIYIMVDLGYSVNKVATSVQEAVSTAVESTLGIPASAVNVHVCGIALDKE